MGRTDPQTLVPGTVLFDRYRVHRLIAQGGMGAVYEVHHKNLGRRFAAKTLSADLCGNDEAMARFRREADIIAGLRHPNIVDVVDWELLPDGSPVLVMEFLEGEDLASRLARDGAMDWTTFGDVADRVLSALETAHAVQVIHRDLKPANIFLARDSGGNLHPKVVDFGISKVFGKQTLAITDSQVLGTPSYMAPEQAEGRGKLVGPATDAWAMAAILYEMATGRMAFDGDSVPAILYRVCHDRPESLTALRPDAPPALEHVLLRGMTRDPAVRIGDVRVLRAELRAALAAGVGSVQTAAVASAVTAPAAPRPALTTIGRATGERVAEPSPGPSSRRVAGVAAAVVAAAVIVAAIAVTGGSDREPTRPAPEATPAAAPARTPAVEAPPPAPVEATASETAARPVPAPAVSRPAMVTLTIVSDPPGATVSSAAGELLGRTPFSRQAAPGSAPLQLVLDHSGYRSRTVSWDAAGDRTIEVALQRRERKSSSRPNRRPVGANGTVNPFD